MSAFRLTGAAEADLRAIFQYGLDQFGLETARSYAQGLSRAFEMLAQYPRLARLRSELDPPLRVHPYRSHLIVYRDDDVGITILRVRHGHEDWASGE